MKNVEFVVYPGINILDLTGLLQVFATATRLGRDFRFEAVYEVRVVGVSVTTRSSAGLEILSQPYADGNSDVDTLIVVGGSGVQAMASDHAIVAWLRERASSALTQSDDSQRV